MSSFLPELTEQPPLVPHRPTAPRVATLAKVRCPSRQTGAIVYNNYDDGENPFNQPTVKSSNVHLPKIRRLGNIDEYLQHVKERVAEKKAKKEMRSRRAQAKISGLGIITKVRNRFKEAQLTLPNGKKRSIREQKRLENIETTIRSLGSDQPPVQCDIDFWYPHYAHFRYICETNPEYTIHQAWEAASLPPFPNHSCTLDISALKKRRKDIVGCWDSGSLICGILPHITPKIIEGYESRYVADKESTRFVPIWFLFPYTKAKETEQGFLIRFENNTRVNYELFSSKMILWGTEVERYELFTKIAEKPSNEGEFDYVTVHGFASLLPHHTPTTKENRPSLTMLTPSTTILPGSVIARSTSASFLL